MCKHPEQQAKTHAHTLQTNVKAQFRRFAPTLEFRELPLPSSAASGITTCNHLVSGERGSKSCQGWSMLEKPGQSLNWRQIEDFRNRTPSKSQVAIHRKSMEDDEHRRKVAFVIFWKLWFWGASGKSMTCRQIVQERPSNLLSLDCLIRLLRAL